MTNWNYNMFGTPKGWECPRCGRILAPWMPNCSCEKNKITINPCTHTTTTTGTPKSETFISSSKRGKYTMSVCSMCKYINIATDQYPCNICSSYNMFKEF